MIEFVLKTASALMLGYIAYRDYKTSRIVRGHAILFLLLALASVLVKDVALALELFLFSAIVSIGLLYLKAIKRFDAVVLTGAVLLVENVWFPFLVAVLAGLLYYYITVTRGKPRRWYPYTPLILLAWALQTAWEVLV